MILFAFEGKIQRIGAGKGKFLKAFPKYSDNINPREEEVFKISKGNDKQNKIKIDDKKIPGSAGQNEGGKKGKPSQIVFLLGFFC